MFKKENIKPFAMPALFTALLLLFSYWASAQGNPPPQGNGGGNSGPIDGGAVGLLLGAALYGYKQVKDRAMASRKSEDVDEFNSDEPVI